MQIDLVFLVKFNVPAHYDDGLPHQKHEKPADNRQNQQGDSANGHLMTERLVGLVHGSDDTTHQDVIMGRVLFGHFKFPPDRADTTTGQGARLPGA